METMTMELIGKVQNLIDEVTHELNYYDPQEGNKWKEKAIESLKDVKDCLKEADMYEFGLPGTMYKHCQIIIDHNCDNEGTWDVTLLDENDETIDLDFGREGTYDEVLAEAKSRIDEAVA